MKSLFASSVGPLAFAIAALTMLPAARAQGSSAVTPPSSAGGPVDYDSAVPTSQSVYNWDEVPAGMRVTIVRATFDDSGYQLYDDQGNTILVPFVDQNLYVLRFAQSDGGMYFVHDGSTPSLNVPVDGYLSNAAAEGSKWYPFNGDSDYTGPVYEGPAPSYEDYSDMAWYPGMTCYGGYYTSAPWCVGVAVAQMPGSYFSVGTARIVGWSTYKDFTARHPYQRVYFQRSAATVRGEVAMQRTPTGGFNRQDCDNRLVSGYINRTSSPTYGGAETSRASASTNSPGYSARDPKTVTSAGFASRNGNAGYGNGYPVQNSSVMYVGALQDRNYPSVTGTVRYAPLPVPSSNYLRPASSAAQMSSVHSTTNTGSSTGNTRPYY